MKKIKVNKEWSWIFSEGLGTAYGEVQAGNEVEVYTLKAARPFFFFLKDKNIKETEKLTWIRTKGTYNIDFDPKSSWGKNWTPPPLKEHYKGRLKSNKPVITILNKYNKEWHDKPFNFLSVEAIDRLISRLKKDYCIYYIRQDAKLKAEGYWDDFQGLEFKDHELIKEKHPEVVTIYDYIEDKKLGFNEAQLEILGDSKHVITTAGGGAFIASYFGEDVIIFNCKNCKSSTRGVWSTDSWLKVFNNSNIFGFQDYDEMIKFVSERW